MQDRLIRSSLAYEKGVTVLAKLERMVLVEVLRKFNGNQTHSAKDLRMSRTTLARRIRDHGIVLDYK